MDKIYFFLLKTENSLKMKMLYIKSMLIDEISSKMIKFWFYRLAHSRDRAPGVRAIHLDPLCSGFKGAVAPLGVD